MYASAEDFRGACARHFTTIAPALVVSVGGYSFEEKTAEKIDQSITALGEIIRGGDVVFTHAQLMGSIECRVTEALERHRHWFSEAEMKANIQRFMAEFLAATSDAEVAVPA